MSGQPGKKTDEHRAVPKRSKGQRPTEQEWEQLVVYFLRGHGFMATARMTGFGERTLRRYFHEGLSDGGPMWGRTPIKVLVEQEQAKARALRAASVRVEEPVPVEAEERRIVEEQVGAATMPEREAARKDALDARTAEARLVRLSRGNVVALVGAAVKLVTPAIVLGEAISKAISQDVTLQKIKPAEGLALMRQMAGYVREVVETGHRAMEMERLLLGDPSGANKRAEQADSMSYDEAVTELSNASKLHARLEARGMRVIVGGAGEGQTFDVATAHTHEAAPAAIQPPTGDADAAGAAAEPEEKDPT